jgi:hypothetical protein
MGQNNNANVKQRRVVDIVLYSRLSKHWMIVELKKVYIPITWLLGLTYNGSLGKVPKVCSNFRWVRVIEKTGTESTELRLHGRNIYLDLSSSVLYPYLFSLGL